MIIVSTRDNLITVVTDNTGSTILNLYNTNFNDFTNNALTISDVSGSIKSIDNATSKLILGLNYEGNGMIEVSNMINKKMKIVPSTSSYTFADSIAITEYYAAVSDNSQSTVFIYDIDDIINNNNDNSIVNTTAIFEPTYNNIIEIKGATYIHTDESNIFNIFAFVTNSQIEIKYINDLSNSTLYTLGTFSFGVIDMDKNIFGISTNSTNIQFYEIDISGSTSPYELQYSVHSDISINNVEDFKVSVYDNSSNNQLYCSVVTSSEIKNYEYDDINNEWTELATITLDTSDYVYSLYDYSSLSDDSEERVILIDPSGELISYNVGSGTNLSYPLESSSLSVCFPAGTPVMTDQGNISIEKLNPDIHTVRNKRIVSVVKTIPHDEYLILIKKNAISKHIPSKDTYISKEHKLLYKGFMITANDLEKYCKNVVKIPYDKSILYNVLMHSYEKIIVNNLICETLHPTNILAKIHYKIHNHALKRQIYKKLNEIIKTNDILAYKQLYLSL